MSSSSSSSSSTSAAAAARMHRDERFTDVGDQAAANVCAGSAELESGPLVGAHPCLRGASPSKGPQKSAGSPRGPPGCDLAFRDISCKVKTRGDSKQKELVTILHPISGVIPAGSVVALMGPSGSGKTTLLDCLSGKKQQHEGEVFLNGEPRVYRELQRVAIYVPQEAYYSGLEVVRELLDFSASLKTNYEQEERDALVAGTLEFLGLTKVADKRVGNSRVRGISGGQRQKLMAGQALVSLSQLCFCDEPTSDTRCMVASSHETEQQQQQLQGVAAAAAAAAAEGAAPAAPQQHHSSKSRSRIIFLSDSSNSSNDSSRNNSSSSSNNSSRNNSSNGSSSSSNSSSVTAAAAAGSCVYLLGVCAGLSSTDAATLLAGMRRIAVHCGVTFIVVIHQPRVEVFNCFDQVILLAQGRCVYQGPRAEMEAYFTRLGHSLQLYENPAECYLRLVTPGCLGYCLEALAGAYEQKQRPLDEQRVNRHLRMRQQLKARRTLGSCFCCPPSSLRVCLLLSFFLILFSLASPPVSVCPCVHWAPRASYRFSFKFSPPPSSAACQQTDVAAVEEEGGAHAFEAEEERREAERQKEKDTQDAGIAALGMLLQDQTQRRQAASWFTQYRVLQRRALKRTARDKRAFVLSVISIYCFSVVMGVLFLNVYSREAVFYQLSSHVLMALTLSVIPFVNTIGYLERRLQFMYETSDGYYLPGPYILAETLTTCLLTCSMILPSLVVIFALCGYPFSRLPLTFLLYFLFEALVDALMQLAAALLNTFMSINAVAGGWLFLSSTINGINVNPRTMIRVRRVRNFGAQGTILEGLGVTGISRLLELRSVPAGLRFLTFLSPYFYLFDGVAIALYDGNSEIFDNPERRQVFGFASAKEMFQAFGVAGTATRSTLSPDQWFWLVDVGVLLMWTIACHVLCLCIWRRKRLSK
ncbi:hypothetical protein Esti_001996 [Eimeria stiedai]